MYMITLGSTGMKDFSEESVTTTTLQEQMNKIPKKTLDSMHRETRS